MIASHIGLGFNPSAWLTVADRLAQIQGRRQPFKRKDTLLRGLIFPEPAPA